MLRYVQFFEKYIAQILLFSILDDFDSEICMTHSAYYSFGYVSLMGKSKVKNEFFKMNGWFLCVRYSYD